MSTYDVVITGGRIVDGCGNPWYRGDVGVTHGTATTNRGAAASIACAAASRVPT